jgi:hypothetical protein
MRQAPLEFQIVPGTHALVQAIVLQERPTVLANGIGLRAGVETEHLDLAGGGNEQPQQQPYRGRLAGSVGSQEAEYLAPFHGEAHLIHGL